MCRSLEMRKGEQQTKGEPESVHCGQNRAKWEANQKRPYRSQ